MATATREIYTLIDPTTQPIVPTFELAPRLGTLANLRVGLIDDAKDNARELLEEVTDALRERYGVSNVVYHRKPSASKPAEPDVIQDMARDCDYVVVAIGS